MHNIIYLLLLLFVRGNRIFASIIMFSKYIILDYFQYMYIHTPVDMSPLEIVFITQVNIIIICIYIILYCIVNIYL